MKPIEATVSQEEAERAKAERDSQPNPATEEETPSTEEVLPEVEETPEEVSQETSKETPDNTAKELEEKNKQLFERAKKAEDALKALKTKHKTEGADNLASADPIDLAKTVHALKSYSPDEMDYIQLIANAKNITLSDAVKTEEVTTYIGARREKAVKDKLTPSPSSPASSLGETQKVEEAAKTKESWDKYEAEQLKKFKQERRGI